MCSTWCLYCRDLVGPLDGEQRILQLTLGFIRQHSEYELPDALLHCFLAYIGGPDNFHHRQLKTLKELDEHWYGHDSYLCRATRIFLIALAAIIALAFLFGKDIAALVVLHTDECSTSTIEQYPSLNADLWLHIASLTHLITVSVMLCSCCLFVAASIRDLLDEIFKRLIGVAGVCISLWWCFFVTWTVFGYFVMRATDGVCSDMIEWWLILEAAEIFVAIGAVVVSCIMGFRDNLHYDENWLVALGFVLFALFVAKDVAGLTINANNDCDAVFEKGHSSFVSFGANTWMLSGAMVHLTVGFCQYAWLLISVMWFDALIWSRGIVWGTVLPWLFFISWSVIGFLMYSEMDSDSNCAKMTLSWSVIEAIGVLVMGVSYVGIIVNSY